MLRQILRSGEKKGFGDILSSKKTTKFQKEKLSQFIYEDLYEK